MNKRTEVEAKTYTLEELVGGDTVEPIHLYPGDRGCVAGVPFRCGQGFSTGRPLVNPDRPMCAVCERASRRAGRYPR